ncbi:hypothetical protein HALDL1_06155 [Halobacterium sp. DL1]|jgi:hypothetical protein|nr:hypothetical protein HALDL1_06155 [Halobacterium sp. DL1]
MGDTKDGRDKQAQDERRRQIERATKEELTRYHETEPPRELDDALEELEYPAPADQVVEAAGEYEVQTEDDAIPVAEVVEESARDEYESPEDARQKLQRPSVAASLRRLETVSRETGLREQFRERRDAYKKTLRALEDVDADDEDEGIAFVTAWLIDEMRENERLPKSRKVRKRAAKFCRSNGYEVRNDDWLGA